MAKTIVIDVTPKWVNLVGLFAEWLQRGTADQRTLAKDEMRKMAVMSDDYRENAALYENAKELFDVALEALNDQDRLKEPFRNAAIAERLRKVLETIDPAKFETKKAEV